VLLSVPSREGRVYLALNQRQKPKQESTRSTTTSKKVMISFGKEHLRKFANVRGRFMV
jgi:hypothetical protein